MSTIEFMRSFSVWIFLIMFGVVRGVESLYVDDLCP